MKVLIVDDNYAVRKMIRSLLSTLASEIIECDDGADVVDIYSHHRPDWILIDIKVKNIDGISVTKNLKKIFPSAKIVVITNYPAEDFKDQAIESGATAFFQKDELVEVLELLKAV